MRTRSSKTHKIGVQLKLTVKYGSTELWNEERMLYRHMCRSWVAKLKSILHWKLLEFVSVTPSPAWMVMQALQFIFSAGRVSQTGPPCWHSSEC